MELEYLAQGCHIFHLQAFLGQALKKFITGFLQGAGLIWAVHNFVWLLQFSGSDLYLMNRTMTTNLRV